MPSPSQFTRYEERLQGPVDYMDVVGFASDNEDKEPDNQQKEDWE